MTRILFIVWKKINIYAFLDGLLRNSENEFRAPAMAFVKAICSGPTAAVEPNRRGHPPENIRTMKEKASDRPSNIPTLCMFIFNSVTMYTGSSVLKMHDAIVRDMLTMAMTHMVEGMGSVGMGCDVPAGCDPEACAAGGAGESLGVPPLGSCDVLAAACVLMRWATSEGSPFAACSRADGGDWACNASPFKDWLPGCELAPANSFGLT